LTFQPSRRKVGVSSKIGARRRELRRNIEHILSKFVAEYVNFAKQRPGLQWTAEMSTRPRLPELFQEVLDTNQKVLYPWLPPAYESSSLPEAGGFLRKGASMSRQKILVIEDDPDILELLEYNLHKQNFIVKSCNNGEEGLKIIENYRPALIILDIMLPGIDGLEVCKRVKMNPETAQILILMLTAKSQESDIVVGLELGADDYLTKPFSPNELVARVRARLRSIPEPKAHRMALGPITIFPEKYEVYFHEKPIVLTLSEFRLLLALTKNPGKVFSREQLLTEIGSEDTFVIDRNIDVHIRSIRKKLSDQGKIIQTIRGVGYRCQELPTEL